MTVICLEGPSAVGKSTSAVALAERLRGAVIPEANALFARPSDASATWYFERQADRWVMAQEHLQAGRMAVLDGDPFQPLWYNWAYDFVDWQPLGITAAFYREQIEAGHIAFPYRYFLLSADEATLRSRRDGDRAATGRRRGGFERHLQFVEPQRRYFQAMKGLCDDRVEFLPESTFAKTLEGIVRSVMERPPTSTEGSALALFEEMVRWLERNSPA
jgi:hypothetical protein